MDQDPFTPTPEWPHPVWHIFDRPDCAQAEVYGTAIRHYKKQAGLARRQDVFVVDFKTDKFIPNKTCDCPQQDALNEIIDTNAAIIAPAEKPAILNLITNLGMHLDMATLATALWTIFNNDHYDLTKCTTILRVGPRNKLTAFFLLHEFRDVTPSI